MKRCKYCNQELNENCFENKIGFFCSEDHYNRYLASLSDDEYVAVMNSFCICSDEE